MANDAAQHRSDRRLGWALQKLKSAFKATIDTEALVRASAPPSTATVAVPLPIRDPLEPRLVTLFDRDSDELDEEEDSTQPGVRLVRRLYRWARQETFEVHSVRSAGSAMTGPRLVGGQLAHDLLKQVDRAAVRDSDVVIVWAEDGFAVHLPTWGEWPTNGANVRECMRR